MPSVSRFLLLVLSANIAVAAPAQNSAPSDTTPAFTTSEYCTGDACHKQPIFWQPADNHVRKCDAPCLDSSSQDLVSADWRDCASLFSAWATTKGSFELGRAPGCNSTTSERRTTGAGFISVMRVDSCTLAVKPSTECGVSIGDLDTSKVLERALKDLSSGTLLAGQGDMSCACQANTGQGKAKVQWRILRSNDA